MLSRNRIVQTIIQFFLFFYFLFRCFVLVSFMKICRHLFWNLKKYKLLEKQFFLDSISNETLLINISCDEKCQIRVVIVEFVYKQDGFDVVFEHWEASTQYWMSILLVLLCIGLYNQPQHGCRNKSKQFIISMNTPTPQMAFHLLCLTTFGCVGDRDFPGRKQRDTGRLWFHVILKMMFSVRQYFLIRKYIYYSVAGQSAYLINKSLR